MYTPQETEYLKTLYAEKLDIVTIAKELNKTPRSVIAKLVREGVYQPPQPAQKISKKTILKEISDLTEQDFYALEPASKIVLQKLLDYLKDLQGC